jgi:hypothetical protein
VRRLPHLWRSVRSFLNRAVWVFQRPISLPPFPIVDGFSLLCSVNILKSVSFNHVKNITKERKKIPSFQRNKFEE